MRTSRYNFTLQRTFFTTTNGIRFLISLCLPLITLILNAQEFKIYPGCNVVLNGNVQVVVNNTALKNNGIFSAGSSTVHFTGSNDTTASYLSGTSYTRFYNLTINKSSYGTALKSAAGVKNILTLSAGKLYADGNLTLLSDVSNTARLAVVPPGSDVIGQAMVERYIPAKRAWRLMTAPVTDAASIFASWQNNGVYTPGRGLLVSAPGGSNGLDNSNAASLKAWDVSSQSLFPITNTYASISTGNSGSADNNGYFVFIRGDRNPSNFIVPNVNVTTITAIGKLQTGTQTFNASGTAGKYTLIGNPFASPINFNLLSKTNLVKRFYVWDPTLNQLGAYVVLDDLDNDGVYTKSVAGSAQTKDIQSTQAFFVETMANGAASLSIPESAKSTTNNSNVFRPVTGTMGSIKTDLFLLNTDGSVVLADGALAEFNEQFQDIVTNDDALKFGNINEGIGMLRNGTVLAIERRPILTSADTLFFKLSKVTQRKYQLQLMPENIDTYGLTAFFEDSYLAASYPISISEKSIINFSIDANAASAAPNRFRIVFKSLFILPVTFTEVNAVPVNDNIAVRWKVTGDITTTGYEVEKSTDGVHFTQVNIAAKTASGNYLWLDVNAVAGRNFYRIKGIEQNGQSIYSRIVSVIIEKNTEHFTIKPNPVRNNNIRLHFINQPAGNYQFNLLNSIGQLVYSTKQQIDAGSTSKILNINNILQSGVYQLQITGPSNATEIQKVVIE